MNKFLKEIVPYIIVIIIVILIKTYIFTPIVVNGESMMSTLHDKDVMILNIIDAKINGINRFDIVVVKTKNSKIIKRVIALPGETVSYKDNKLYINGEEMDDPYGSCETEDFDEVLVEEDSYFVLGDNRCDSADSRIIGAVSKENILGKTSLVIFPFSRIGIKN